MQRKKKQISKTSLLQTLQRSYKIALHSKLNGIPTNELIDEQFQKSRRKFLGDTGKAALITTIAGSSFLASCADKSAPVITIVGAGIAGLNAAYTLKRSGYFAQIYEASPRTGGRMFTAKDIMGAGLTTELGGEFIDTAHVDIFDLAKKFELPIVDTQIESEKKLIHACYYFDGKILTDKDIIEMLTPYVMQMQKDIDSMSEEITYNNHSEDDARLDKLSIADYLTSIGITGTLFNLFDVAYTTEYGSNTSEQSSINLLYLIAPEMTDEFNYSGYSDERYKIEGGNQRIPDELAKRMENQIHVGYSLEAVSTKNGGKKIILHFIQSNGAAIDVETDYAIITVPFTILRDVKWNVELSPVKKKAIDEMGYGKNAKLMIGFQKPLWRELGYAGFTFSDNGLQNCWDNSQMQKGDGAGLTVFTGGTAGEELIKGTDKEQAAIYLARLDAIYPQISGFHNQKSARFHWPTYQYTKASYTCFKPGQFTSIEGSQREPEGNIYFAGEHCSYEFQGFMNGGAQTGRVAAEQILEKIK
jgi:monoamine oxidase